MLYHLPLILPLTYQLFVLHLQIFDMAPKKRERCLQEVQLLQTCKHPNIIQMLDAFIDENQLIIVFEWAPAGAQGIIGNRFLCACF